nr:hypothetical protein [Terribacillus saccharophilus]
MSSIVELKYPESRDWNIKVFAMPRIPRSKLGYPESLRLILQAVKENTPKNTVINIPGSTTQNTLEELCIRLRPMGFVFQRKVGSTWELSSESNVWLENQDNIYLSSFLNANIRFISELLNELKEVHNTKEILSIANTKYLIGWKGKSQVNDRLQWLSDLGLVVYREYSNEYLLTELGCEFLNIFKPIDPNSIMIDTDNTKNEESVPVSDWALKLCELTSERLQARKTSIGYVPGKSNEIYQTIISYLQLMQQPTSKDSIVKYSKESYQVSSSSISGFLSTLTNSQLVKRVSNTHYVITDRGKLLIDEGTPVDLICCLHSSFKYVFELLYELSLKEFNSKELTSISVVSYGFEVENKNDIRKRIIFLKSASLIQDSGKNFFKITERGKKLLNLITLEKPYQNEKDKEEEEKKGYIFKDNDVNSILTEMRLASRDSSNPTRFEKSLVNSFSLLGFNATWLGGSGQTDVLLKAPTAPKFTYSVAVDAKSTSNGAVLESQINFDTLLDHKKKHNTDFLIVVGYNFQGSRLTERAKKHGVVLLPIENLETLITQHIKVPLQFNAYKKLFAEPGLANISVIDSDRDQMIRNSKLFRSILNCLSEESMDPETQGFLMPRDIYQLLKRSSEFEIPLTTTEIETMLNFLSSPFIGCVGSSKEGYFALGSISDARKKFEFYSVATSKY